MELPVKMELPDDILSIIKEYSKPLTNPKWRKLKKLQLHVLRSDFNTCRIKNCIQIWNHNGNTNTVFTIDRMNHMIRIERMNHRMRMENKMSAYAK